MANTGARRGVDLHTYRNTGTYGSPVWSELTNLRDQKKGLSRTEINSSIRGFSNIETAVAGLIKCEPSWQMIYDQSDANLVAIQSAFWSTVIASNQIEFAFSDGPIGGSGIRYLRAVCAVLGCDDTEDLDGIAMVDVKVKPTYNSNAPTIVTA